MNKFLFLLGAPRCATSWLHQHLTFNHTGIGYMPKKEIHFWLRHFGDTDRLTDDARLFDFARYVEKRRIAFADTAKFGDFGLAVAKGSYAQKATTDPSGLWSKGGRALNRFKRLEAGVEWYMKYIKGPVDLDWYRSLYAHIPDTEWATDFSTTNGYITDEGFRTMASFVDTTKVLVILRHPLDRLSSHLSLVARKDQKGMRQKIDTWPAERVEKKVSDKGLLGRSLYAEMVCGAMDHFAPEDRLFLDYEDLAADPAGTVRQVANFLGIEANEAHLETLAPRKGFQKGARKPHKNFASYVATCLDDLKKVSNAGVEFVDPWIADLEGALKDENSKKN